MRLSQMMDWIMTRLAPAKRLAGLVAQAHAGKISIEELQQSAPRARRFAALVESTCAVLTDLKQQRADLAVLEQEMRDRIANRTNALERRIGSLQVQAMRDALTGLNNRRALDGQLPKVIERYVEQGVESSVLMIDVDHFKSLNDTLGHGAGDQLLKEIAQLIRSVLRENDQAFRCGGDEFVVLLDGCDLQMSQSIANRLETLVRRHTQTLGVKLPPRLSIGVASVSEVKPPTVIALTQLADGRLYAIKEARPRSRRSA